MTNGAAWKHCRHDDALSWPRPRCLISDLTIDYLSIVSSIVIIIVRMIDIDIEKETRKPVTASVTALTGRKGTC